MGKRCCGQRGEHHHTFLCANYCSRLMKKHRPLLSEQLRRAISASSLTRYRISQETGISQAQLSLFCARKRGLSLQSMDALGTLLDLELKPRKKLKES